MELTFMTDLGHTFVVEIDPNMELEIVMASLEADSGIPAIEQSISYEGRELNNPKATMREYGVKDKAVFSLRRKIRQPVGGRTIEQDAEMMRLQILGNPQLMRQLQEAQPDIAAAAQSNPARFAELLLQTSQRHNSAELARQREIERLNADPFDVEAQRRIEEAIREQAIDENMQHAIEHAPESFGRVTMLYIEVEVNGHPVKACVDSGAQSTMMSPECAEACGIMRLLDHRFSGIARGVGAAKILGRIHTAQIRVADVFLPCSFTVMEGRDVDLLFGLDMLKTHLACIDLERNVLRIQGREVPFLPEHELPEKARLMNAGIVDEPSSPPVADSSTPSSSDVPAPSFPGGGNTLGGRAGGQATGARPAQQTRHSESAIQTLIDLGATRQLAISTLDAAGGNLDVAASLLF